MHTRREILVRGATLAGSLIGDRALGVLKEESLVSADDLDYLRRLAQTTIASATKDASVARLGFPVITPGGAYPAFWVRDFSMAAGCGLVPPETIRKHLRLVAQCQNGASERRLGDGRAVIPAWAIPDHVNYDGGAVFYPGTYSSGDDQGGEPYGVLPPVDDHYEFVHLAHLVWKKTRSAAFLGESVDGKPLCDRLVLALDCPRANSETGLVETSAADRAVGFGFCDGIYFTGSMLFPSLLRYRALGEMIELARAAHRTDGIKRWTEQQRLISQQIVKTFEVDGWLKASTLVGQQPDVWGTIYALYLGVPMGSARQRLLKTVAGAVRAGAITYKGAVRHVPTDHDFSATSAWEKTAGEPLNRYQNGAYWHVPSGWLARVLWQVDKPLARKLVREMLAHFREESAQGAPWECIHPDHYRQNPVYMASVTLPLEALNA